jgi:protein-disulfide isomerase
MSAFSFARLAVPVLAALALVACDQQAGGGGSASGSAAGLHIGDVTLGDKNAPVEIVEYASLTCTHCRDFWKQDFPRLKADYIDTGKVKFTLKDFPTAPAEIAVAAVGIARCKGADKYYAIVDDVFTAQYDILMAARDGGSGAHLAAIGEKHGITPEEIRACVADKRIEKHIDDTVKEGQAAGVRSTPTVFLNGERVEDHRYAQLTAAIEKALNPNAPAATPAAADGPAPTTPGAADPTPTPAPTPAPANPS